MNGHVPIAVTKNPLTDKAIVDALRKVTMEEVERVGIMQATYCACEKDLTLFYRCMDAAGAGYPEGEVSFETVREAVERG